MITPYLWYIGGTQLDILGRSDTSVHLHELFVRHALQASTKEVLLAEHDEACVPDSWRCTNSNGVCRGKRPGLVRWRLAQR